MSVALVTTTHYRPFFQAIVAPAKVVYAIFLKALGYLLALLGAKEWGKHLQIKADKIDSRCTSLLTGLWHYGRRFLIHANNYEQSCRGSCYWLVAEHLRHPEIPLTELLKPFETGVPPAALALHKSGLPPDLTETRLWAYKTEGPWPPPPRLASGVYTLLIGFSENKNTPTNGHRIAFFGNKHLFDPNTGLSQWAASDWEPLLTRIAQEIRTAPGGFFTIACYSYQKRQ